MICDKIWRFLVEHEFTSKDCPEFYGSYTNGHIEGEIAICETSPDYLSTPELLVLHECLHYVCWDGNCKGIPRSAHESRDFAPCLMLLVEHGCREGFSISQAEIVMLRMQVVEDARKDIASREMQDKLMKIVLEWYKMNG